MLGDTGLSPRLPTIAVNFADQGNRSSATSLPDHFLSRAEIRINMLGSILACQRIRNGFDYDKFDNFNCAPFVQDENRAPSLATGQAPSLAAASTGADRCDDDRIPGNCISP